MLKIITANVNGIRAAQKKGFFTWLNKQQADIICLQETKAQEHQLQDPVFTLKGYYRYFFDAIKKGYSGVAIYSKHQPDNIATGIGLNFADAEGRFIEIAFGKLHIASVYLPSGTSGSIRQDLKYKLLDYYEKILLKNISSNKSYIICGDWNIAHNNIDLKNWRNNQKNSGFLPEERAWLDNLFNNIGYVDSFRYKNPTTAEYTWWSNRANAWENNVGWRIDYQIITPDLQDSIIDTNIYREEKFSDHAPFTVTYDLNIK